MTVAVEGAGKRDTPHWAIPFGINGPEAQGRPEGL